MQEVREAVNCGLVDIVVFDSYIKGKHSVLNLSGHANISGTNGKGKTSTLSLIPLFFGATPDKLVNRSKGRFVDFYLPSNQSFIAYQYQRFDGMCSVFVYANKSRDGSLCYRFAKGSVENITQSVEFKELLSTTKSISDTFKKLSFNPKFEITSQIENTVDYEAILCNNKKALRKKTHILSEPQRFSLCHTDYQLKSLAFLTMVSMSEKDDLFEKLKAMIVDSFSLSDVDVASPPKEFNIVELSSCIRTLVNLRSKESRFTAGIELSRVNKNLYSDLLFYRDDSKRLLVVFGSKIEDIANKIKLLDEEREGFVAQINQHIGKNAERLKTIEGEINSLQATLKNIKTEEERYKSENISGKREEYQSLENLKSKKMLAEQNLERMQNMYQDVHKDLVHELSVIDAQVHSLVANCGGRINDVKDQKTEVNKRKFTEITNLDEKLKEQTRLLREEFDKAYDLLQKELSEASFVHGLSTSLTSEEKSRLNDYELEINGLMNSFRGVREAIKNQKILIDDSNEKHKKVCQQLEVCILTISELEQEMNLHRELHFGGRNLLSNLRQNLDADDLKDALKIISKDLLIRSDILVEKVEDSNFFFGLELGLQNLPVPKEADSEDELHLRMETMDNQLKEYKNNKTLIEKDASICFEALKAQQIEMQKMNLEADKKESEINALYKAKDSYSYQCSERAKARVLEAENCIEKIKAKILTHKRDMEQQIKSLTGEYDARKKDFVLSIESELNTLVMNEKNINLEIEKIHSDAEQQKQEFRLAYQKRLKEKGVDVDVLKKFELELENASASLKRVIGYSQLLNEYDNWVKITLARKPEYIDSIQSLNNEMRSLETSNKSLRSDKQAKEIEIKACITNLVEEQGEYKANSTVLRSFLDRVEGFVQDFVGVEPSIKIMDDFNVFKSSFEKAFSDFRQQTTTLRGLISTLDEDLRNDPAGTISQAWFKRKELHSEYKGHPYHNILIVEEMERLIEQDVKNLERVSVLQFQNSVIQVNEYYESLHAFKNRVNRMSKELDDYIQIQNPFEDVKNIKLSVTSLIDEQMPVYGKMKKLKNEFALSPLSKIAYEGQDSILPEEKLIASLEDVLLSLRAANFNQKSKNDLVNLNISLIENTELRTINSNATFKDFSSKGLSRLVILMIFSALTRYLNQDPLLKINIPFDELGEISQVNCVRLFRLLEERNIRVFCAQPDVNENLYDFFKHKYLVDINNGLKQVKVDESCLLEENPLLAGV